MDGHSVFDSYGIKLDFAHDEIYYYLSFPKGTVIVFVDWINRRVNMVLLWMHLLILQALF